jgi:hypothetical protein
MIFLEMPGGPEFAVAFYRWALEQWSDELEHDFPVLRAIQGEQCILVRQLLLRRPKQEQVCIARLLAKRFHPQAATILGDPLSAEESERIKPLDGECLWGLDRWSVMEACRKTNRSLLKKCVREAIEPVLGSDREQYSGSSWEYHTQIGRWRIDTAIDFAGGTSYSMAYNHDIVAMPEGVLLARDLSAPAWLGVTSSGSWSGLSEADIPAAAAGLAFVCKRFLDAIPRLLPG